MSVALRELAHEQQDQHKARLKRASPKVPHGSPLTRGAPPSSPRRRRKSDRNTTWSAGKAIVGLSGCASWTVSMSLNGSPFSRADRALVESLSAAMPGQRYCVCGSRLHGEAACPGGLKRESPAAGRDGRRARHTHKDRTPREGSRSHCLCRYDISFTSPHSATGSRNTS